jgi:hypothetical protein
MSRPVSVASYGALQLTPTLHKQPLAELLLANLRLLDLDLREDWPDITIKTFSTKDTQQNQKQRIKCTEWILYRLFELWEPEETRDKLQPFFPPLEPLQSLNLRGALFRSLNELKKNGVLGRESVLRKTMLDECKGEKLMELLVIFSTVVVRRKDAAKAAHPRSVAYRVATVPMLSAAQQGSLIPLAVAHAASITNMLKEREEKRQRYARFNDLLDGKRAHLRQRVKAFVQTRRRESNVNEEAQVKKVVQENWAGHSRWPQALLIGDDTNAGDLPLQKPFHEIWLAVSEGGQMSGDPSSLGLLASLERRVQMQKERFQMWQEFHDNLKVDEEGGPHVRLQDTPATTKFTFDRHQQLQLVPGRVTNGHHRDLSTNDNTYSAILGALRSDIANASKSRRMGGAGWTSKRDEVSAEYLGHDLFSPIKGSAPAATATVKPAGKGLRRFDIMQDRPSLLAPTNKPKLNGFKLQRFVSSESKPDIRTLAKPTPVAAPVTTAAKVEPEREATPEMNIKTPVEVPAQESPVHEETAADRIISSVMNATPSPAKQQMSLTERTRMSMAFFNGAIATKEPPDSIDSGIALPSASLDSESEDEDDTMQATKGGNNRRVSLLERTRMSMAQIPSQPLKSKKSINRESRQSLFPINQFETPGKPRAVPEPPRRDATPTEKLFSDDVDYASVFKSRPRIALSPVFSPDEHSSFAGLDESLDSDGEEGDSSELGGGFATSPLARRKVAAIGER